MTSNEGMRLSSGLMLGVVWLQPLDRLSTDAKTNQKLTSNPSLSKFLGAHT
jgi:hypothetical protein